MRRFVTLLLTLAMVLSLTLGAAAAEETPSLALEVNQTGGNVEVSVYLQGCAGVTNGRFVVCYDQSALKLLSAEATDAMAHGSINSNEAGKVALAWVGSDLTGEKTLLLKVKLEAAEGVEKELTYSAEADGIYTNLSAVEVAGCTVSALLSAPADATQLQKAIDAAKALNKSEYTADSFAMVEAALEEAVLLLTNADATQEQLDTATQKLVDAIAGLVKQEPGVNTTELKKQVSKAKSLKKDDYTEESFAVLEKALAEAEAVLNKEDATQEDVAAAAKALTDALAALKKVSPAPTGDEVPVALLIAMMTLSAFGIGTVAVMLRLGMKKQVCRFFSVVLVIVLVGSMLPANAFSIVTNAAENALQDLVKEINTNVNLKLDQNMNTQLVPYEDDELVRVIVELDGKGLLEQGYTREQIAEHSWRIAREVEKLETVQNYVADQIVKIVTRSGLVDKDQIQKVVRTKYHYTIALNGIAMTVPYGVLEKIRNLSGVENAYVVTQYMVPETAENVSDPNMYATNSSFGTAKTWNELGYTGKGMTIAVIDTGLDVDHPSFAAAPEGAAISYADVEAVLTQLNAYSLYAETSALDLTADKLYYSEKVPFGFNYVDSSIDVTHDYDDAGDHGTHVAGICAANRMETTDVVGVAPDAQILVMKVFGVNGGAYADDIIAAIEDCILLDVDVINMSLGAPAGFSEESYLINEVYGRILDTDMILAVAAGNSNSAATGNSLGTNLNLTQDPDNGLVTSPSTYLAATTVASLENGSVMMPYFTIGESKIPFVDATYVNFTALAGTWEYVIIPGLGEEGDYEGLDVNGKIAVVQRGTIDFETKQYNAYMAGASAMICYNNVDGDMISMYDGGYLPNVFISKADGQIMLDAAVDGKGTLEIMPYGMETAMPSAMGGLISDFSCWGVTPDLQLSPDVTAPGGNIYSTYTDGAYGTMSGTSMACPHIAGMSALLLQYLHDKYPDMTGAEYHIAAESLLMCTAVPVIDPDGIHYSPRKQGAGSADVYKALTSPVYLTALQVTGEHTPKISLGDDPERTGVYTFTFDMHNMTGTDQLYYLDGVTLTDQFVEIEGREFMGETGRYMDSAFAFQVPDTGAMPQFDANGDGSTTVDDVLFLLEGINGLTAVDESVIKALDIHADGKLDTMDAQMLYLLLLESYEAQRLVLVPAGTTVTVSVTVTVSEEDKAYMEDHYENGIYVDGFVRCFAQSEGGVDLSLPFVGFYGDWHDARMFDTGWYYEDEDIVEYNRYLHVIFATMGPDLNNAGGLGMNPYILEDYDPEHNVLSPNGDTYYDYVNEIYVSLLRSAELLDFTWTDDATGEELFYEYYAYARKGYYWPAYGMAMPVVYTDGGLMPYTFYDENGNLEVHDLQHLTLTIRGYLDDGDLDEVEADEFGNPDPDPAWADDVMEIPVVIDLAAPKVDIASIQYFTQDGRNYISFDVSDNYDIAAVVPMTMGGDAYEYVPVTTKTPGVDGEKDTVVLDITEYDSVFQLALCDYGCNETYYELINPFNQGLQSKFYAFRRYSTPVVGDTIYTTEELNGWYSFNSADDMLSHTSQVYSGEATVFAAEYIDGYIFGAQSGENGYNTLFAMKAGSWERTPLGDEYELRKIVYEWPGQDGTYFPLHLIALDMAYDYTSDTLYMLANGLENNYFPEGADNVLLKVDYMTGKTTVLGIIDPAGDDPFVALTLACDNEGVLYTVDYETGKLFTVSKEPVSVTEKYGYGVYEATAITTGETQYWPAAYTQSMAVDHNTNKLYWAGYQGKVGVAYFMELDKTTGEVLSITTTEDNAEMTGLFVPYDPGVDIIPDAEATGMHMSAEAVYLNLGQTTTLRLLAEPFNAPAGEVTFSSTDETIATVTEYGLVEAKGVGSTEIIAVCGEFTAVCTVNVASLSGTVYAYSGGNWLLFDAGAPDGAMQVTDAMELEGTVKAAAYRAGYLYVAAVEEDYDAEGNAAYRTNFYKLNAATLHGELIGSFDGDVTALAFNYADGYLYGLAHSEILDENWNSTVSYQLIRVNMATAEVAVVTTLDTIFPYSDLIGTYSTCSGALAIDYQGNFYVNGDVCTDPENWEYDYALVRFNLDENDNLTNITTATGFSAYGWSGDAMVWSERNAGLLHVAGDTLEWVDVSDMENIVTVSMGAVRGAAGDVFALAMPITAEPAIPVIAPENMTIAEGYSVPRGESIRIVPTLLPWNATGEFTYEIADETIAMVDENGLITGIAEGQTTLTIYAVGTELSVTTTITVEKNPGYLYGYFQADIAQQIPLEYWGKIAIANPANSKPLTDLYSFTIYAAAYYDGFVYAMGQSEIDGACYMLKIIPTNFSYEVLGACDRMVRDMAFDYTTGTMYAVAYDEMVSGGLYQMDISTGKMTLVGDNDLGVTLVTLAIDSTGTVYASDEQGAVYTVNKHTVQLTATGIQGTYSQYLQSMTYDYNSDGIYWAQGGTLYLVDVANGQLTKVGMADVESGEMATTGCIVSGLFSVPSMAIPVPETVAPAGIVMDEKNTVAVGGTLTLNAVVLPVSVSTVDQTLVWSSADETVATVDANGVITGVNPGQTYIYAQDASGNVAQTLITVTAEGRSIYGYDELSGSWMQFDFSGKVLGTWKDDAGLSPIVAAQYIGETLYAYDADGYFYTVDTATFQRTLLGDGIHGMTASMAAWDSQHEGGYFVDGVPYSVIDMTYAETENGVVAYAVIMAYNVSEYQDSFAYQVAEIDLSSGCITRVIVEDAMVDGMSLRPTNLLWRNGYLYTVNGYITGLVTQIDPETGSLTGIAIFPEYWGDFNGGRGILEDPLTGKVYAIRDKRTEYIGSADYDPSKASSILVEVGIGMGYAEEVCELGAGLRICGLFIR